MRCICCNKQLNDFESTRRHAITREFLDMCNSCHASVASSSRLPTIDRKDLDSLSGIEEELDNDDNQCYPTFKEL
jgi:hypothetical protein